MRQIQISDDAYQALASQHGDVAAFVETIARELTSASSGQPATKNGEAPAASLHDALLSDGLLGKYDDLPADLSTNPKHLEAFGE